MSRIKNISVKRRVMAIFAAFSLPTVLILCIYTATAMGQLRTKLAKAGESSLSLFAASLQTQMNAAETYMVDTALHSESLRRLGEQTGRTQAYLDGYEVSQGFSAVLSANESLMGMMLYSVPNDLFIAKYSGAVAGGGPDQKNLNKLAMQSEMKALIGSGPLNLGAWFAREIGGRIYWIRVVRYRSVYLSCAIDLGLLLNRAASKYAFDGQLALLDQNGGLVAGSVDALPEEMKWLPEGYGTVTCGGKPYLGAVGSAGSLQFFYLMPFQGAQGAMRPMEMVLFTNIPNVSLGVIAVSRSCFPASLSQRRRQSVAAAYGKGLYECPIVVENELDAKQAVEDVKAAGVNALVVFLGNFGPETPETLIADWFDGPIMYIAAAEGDGDLHDGRGDAYCGMLNCSYNLGLRGRRAYIPEYPVGTAEELAEKIRSFEPVARAILGLQGLKVITFGPRPDDFLACNGPIKALYDLGVAVEENSELDLLAAYNQHANDVRIPDKIAEMQAELGEGNPYAGILPRLAQYELTLLDWAEAHKGARQYVAFANKCWPAFQTEFRFVPCYVNSRLAGMGIPVACEVDIYGALSQYIGVCVSGSVTTLLDINNTMPSSIYNKAVKGKYNLRLPETFMGFHCGNTCSSLLKNPHMGYQLIMKRDLEPELPEPDITRGTMEGNLKPGEITFFRLQSTADTQLKAYIAHGSVLDVDCESFGSIGAFAIPEMDRFYRHVLIEKRYPHHGAVAFGHWGGALFEVFKYLGVLDISYNQPKSLPYPGENPFA